MSQVLDEKFAVPGMPSADEVRELAKIIAAEPYELWYDPDS